MTVVWENQATVFFGARVRIEWCVGWKGEENGKNVFNGTGWPHAQHEFRQVLRTG